MDAGGTSADCWPSKDETSFPYQYSNMSKDKQKTDAGDETALREWEAEGGSLGFESWRRKHIGLGEQEQYVLCCLGGAVLMQWKELPTNIQRALFERAASLSKEDQTLALREQIARFLHNHKDD
jgi:hypothetical protein